MPAADRVGSAGPAASGRNLSPMSLAASQRRDQRRRLVLSWNRSGSTSSSPAAEPRRLADYAPDALPERQPSLATLVPTGLGGLSLAAGGLVSLMAAATGVGVWEAVTGTALFGQGGGRFALSIAAVRECLDIRTFSSLGGWLAQLCLVIATAAALVVRLMRRHRRDDFRGRYRAWASLAGLFVLTACAAHVPLARVVGGLLSDATGLTLGPAGIGWWVVAASVAYAVVCPWAVLPLHDRAATAIWMTLAMAAWAVAAGCGWAGRERELWLVVGNASWMGGAACAAIAMLAAARSVIREVRGLPTRQPAKKQSTAAAAAQAAGQSAKKSAVPSHQRGGAEEAPMRPDREDVDQPQFTAYVDGSEAEDDGEEAGRHLSKAERKRLRKLARMNRAA